MVATGRLHVLRNHLAGHTAPAAAVVEQQPWSQPERIDNPRLLSDAEMQRYVVDGFLVLPLDEFDQSFHRKIYNDAHAIFERSGRAGGGVGPQALRNSNDIYPAIPEIGDIMGGATIAGALESVLGPGYQMNSHRHMHNSSFGQTSQTFHKDSQRNKPPSHFTNSVFIFYYPGGVTDNMGPTELCPMSQYLGSDDQDWAPLNESRGRTLSPAVLGQRITTKSAHQPVAVLAHMGMIHRATHRLVEEDENHPWRPMLKFIFSSSPSEADQSASAGAPSWDHQPESVRPWYELTDEPALIPAMQTHWEWLLAGRGKHASRPIDPSLGDSKSIEDLRNVLLAKHHTGDEAKRVGAAYQLGRTGRNAGSTEGQAALEALTDALHGRYGQAPQRVAISGFASAGPSAVDLLCHTLTTSMNDRVLLSAAEALADAVPRDDTQSIAKAITALAAATERLESMTETSPRLKAWAIAAETDDGAPMATGIFAKGRRTERQQWEFAEDTALQCCRAALNRLL